MKKALALLLAAVFVLGWGSAPALAADYDGVATPASVLLLDPDSGETLYAKDADARIYPASTTKILTTLVVLEQVEDLQSVVTVDSGALATIVAWDDNTLLPMLEAGEQLTVEQLLYGLLLMSGNDCANALAFYVAGGLDAFAELMNRKAAELGMADSQFRNPHGMPNEEHYTTARDMARAAAAALDEPEFMRIVSTAAYTIPATNRNSARDLTNSNRLLLERESMPGTGYAFVTGMKTGFTSAAGGCFVGSAEKDGRRLICLIFGDSSEDLRDRWFLAKDLFMFGFDRQGGEESYTAAAVTAAAAEEEAPSPVRSVVWTVVACLLLLLVLAILAMTALWLRAAAKRAGGTSAGRLIRGALPTTAAALLLLGSAVMCLRQSGSLRQEREAYLLAAEAETIFLEPAAVESTDPSRWEIGWSVVADGGVVSGYQRTETLSFGDGTGYFRLPGVAGFRGGNFRDGGSYGAVSVSTGAVSSLWSVSTGSPLSGDGTTGQPLMVQWDAGTRSVMDLYDGKKDKDGLVEVICPSPDGYVYFLDLEDGSYTRAPLYLGEAFSGTGALDPRGWPLLYLGSGGDGAEGRMYIVSLVDGSVLYECGFDDAWSPRGEGSAFRSSPLVDAETDTLLWPGENGVLYTIRLNTEYKAKSGRLTVAPEEPVRARYDIPLSGEESRDYGYESSAVIAGRCLYLSENGGLFFCVDLDTMELVWAQDLQDAVRATPVYEPAGDDHGSLYTASALLRTVDSEGEGVARVYKLDALTGEVIWSRNFYCTAAERAAGGVLSSPVLGRAGSDIEGLVICCVSRVSGGGGTLAALDARTGSEVWSLSLDHDAGSSPLALYDEAGRAWLVLCDSAGGVHLIEGATGRIAAGTDLGAAVEASPAAFDGTLVAETRDRQICALRVY